MKVMPKAAFYTLGCKINQTETAALQSLFTKAGYETVPFTQTADVYIINTCTVTHLGDRKSRQMIRRARRGNPGAVIVVTGCYAQVSPEEVLTMPEIDLVIGTHSRDRLPQLVEEARGKRLNCVSPVEEKHSFESLPAAQTGDRTRAFLKVQEGCRQFCSYCIVPYARGPLFSRSPEETVEEAARLAGQGFLELVLTGVHLGSYGSDLPGNMTISDLIRLLTRVDGIERLRISSIEPAEVTSDFILAVMDEPKVCRHLHIPLQSGDDEILRRMNRKYSARDFLQLVSRLRSLDPDIALTTDIMVGFPGETEEQFKNTLDLAERCRFSRMHIFKYSPRRGTPAAEYPCQVPYRVKEERAARLSLLGDRLAAGYTRRFPGRKLKVIFEEKAEQEITGLTEHYVRVFAQGGESALGKLLDVEITGLAAEGLRGKIINKL